MGQWIAAGFFLLFVGAVHWTILPDYGDDLIYAGIYNAHELPGFLKERYMIWSSRVVIEAVIFVEISAGGRIVMGFIE